MAQILDFQRKSEDKAYKEFHNMWVSQEDDWTIWRCNSCSRKVKMSKDSNEFVVERKGNFYAHHTATVEPALS